MNDNEEVLHTFENVRDIYTNYITLDEDRAIIERAYEFAKKRHEGQFRKSGAPYISHLIEVSYILAGYQTGPATLCAAFLHDTVEDTGTTNEEIIAAFGTEISILVDSVTKIQRLSEIQEEEFRAEGHRKIFIAMAKDIRVIIIKLADRLHNMRTLRYQAPEKQMRISKETMEVYAPIAHRLGFARIKSELEDRALYYLENDHYQEILSLMSARMQNREKSMTLLKKKITDLLLPTKISFETSSRIKSIYSIYKKMYFKHRKFDEIYDIMALRIVTGSELNCYEILGYIHADFKPVPGRFKDYIAMPKPNMYQSLHTTIVTHDGHIFEIQIRTKLMDEIAENGIAAHWRYKEGKKYDAGKEQKEIEEKLHWFRDFISYTNDSESDKAQDYMSTLQHDLFDANVYVFTPRGRVIDLPSGSTPIDFAYKVHTQVGDKMIGAKINDILVPIGTELKTGDIVEIKTSEKSPGPNVDWIKICKTSFAKAKIKKFSQKKNADYVRDDAVAKGKISIIDAFKEKKLTERDLDKILDKKLLEHFNAPDSDELFLMISNRNVMPSQIIEYLDLDKKTASQTVQDQVNKKKLVKEKSTEAVVLEDGEHVLMSLSSCCNPIPGDQIVGYITKGRGVKVHCANCPNIADEHQRLIEVRWNPDLMLSVHPVDIAIDCLDRPNLLIDILNSLSQQKTECYKVAANYYESSNMTTINMTLKVGDTRRLDVITVNLKQIHSVVEVRRVFH